MAIDKKKSALYILLKLLLLLCLIKSIFFIYNYTLFAGWQIHGFHNASSIVCWALYYDAAWASLVCLPFFLACALAPKRVLVPKWLFGIAALLATAMLLLNAMDIFYFSFHRQRADADLLYVLRNPLNYGGFKVLGIFLLVLILFIASFRWWMWEFNKSGNRHWMIGLSITIILGGSLLWQNGKKLLPTAALTAVKPEQLPLTQNSLHTLLYSLYRHKSSGMPQQNLMRVKDVQQYFNIHAQNKLVATTPKNLVLFIMESVPYDFFDYSNKTRPALPFFDSLLNHASFYKNAFSYSYESNKGITAILAGLPTLTDIPLYHSGYVNLFKTEIGKLLAQKKYSSSFFIGDNYDDFGFAKCSNWLGIQHYYSMEAVPGHTALPKHTMGLHDEYVLNFMQQKMASASQPFFNCFYNVSTHFPNDLPNNFFINHAYQSLPAPYKSMLYYDHCMQQFFAKAAAMPWFQNTVFIFCSDHWANPTYQMPENKINSFRIPIIIYDPSVNTGQVQENIVSQLDIMNTILAYAGINQPFKSYGQSLLETDSNRVAFTRMNNGIYQAINNRYVVGMDARDGQLLYGFDYKKDSAQQHNLLHTSATDSLSLSLKAFLQTAILHYKNKTGAPK